MVIINHNALFNEVLGIAEQMFGNRIPSEFYGVIVSDINQPELRPFENGHMLLLTNDCQYDMVRSVFQISHEVIHLLFVTNRFDISYLEEGFAVWFSLYCVNKLANPFYGIYLNSIVEPQNKYSDAYNFFEQIPNKIQFIRKLRNSELNKQISLCESEELNEILQNIGLSDNLAKKFYI